MGCSDDLFKCWPTSILPMTNPLVSVIIPTMDRPDQLKRAVRSVFNQTYDEIELVIIEEGVPEAKVPTLLSTTKIQPDNLIHIFNEAPSGLAAARNQAAAHCSGEYLAFLDDDDEWYPTKIEKQVNKLDSSDADVCYTGVERFGPDGQLRSTTIPDVDGDAHSRTLRGSIIGPSVFMISREAFESVDGFDDDIPYWEDWDFFYRLSQHYRFTGVSEALGKTHADAEERLSDSPELAKQGAIYLISKHIPIDNAESLFSERQFRSRLWQGVGRSYLMNEQYSEARRYFAKSALIWPVDAELLLYSMLTVGDGFVLNIAQRVKRRLANLLSKL